MEIASWILFGLVAGSLAKWIMPGPSAGGLAVAIPVGIGGALLGGLVNTIFPSGNPAGFDIRGLFLAIAGSLLVLLIYRSYALRAAA